MNDAPLDYRSLWMKFRALLQNTGVQKAITAMTYSEDFKIHRAQGAFTMCREAVAMMDDMVDRERGADSAFDESDLGVKH